MNATLCERRPFRRAGWGNGQPPNRARNRAKIGVRDNNWMGDWPDCAPNRAGTGMTRHVLQYETQVYHIEVCLSRGIAKKEEIRDHHLPFFLGGALGAGSAGGARI